MALESTARNVYGPVQLGDLSLVIVVLDSTGRVAADSSPGTAATAAGSGVYNITFPQGERGVVLSTKQVGLAAGTDAEVVAFSPTAGTLQIDTGSDVAAGDQCHVVLLIGQN